MSFDTSARSSDLPVFSSEEMMLLKQLDPTYQSPEEKAIQSELDLNAFIYNKEVLPYQQSILGASDYLNHNEPLSDTFIPGALNVQKFGNHPAVQGKEGGFPWAGVIGAIPSVISAFQSIFGKGIYNPMRGGSPYVAQGYGKARFRSAIAETKKYLKDQGLAKDSAQAEELLHEAGIPRSFAKSLTSKRGSKKSKYTDINNRNTLRPIMKWGLNKLFNEGAYRAHKKALLEGVDDYQLDGGRPATFFERAKDLLISNIPKIKPLMNTLIDKYGSDITASLPGIMNAIFRKTNTPQGIRDLANKGLTEDNMKKLAEYGKKVLLDKAKPAPSSPKPSAPPIGTGMNPMYRYQHDPEYLKYLAERPNFTKGKGQAKKLRIQIL